MIEYQEYEDLVIEYDYYEKLAYKILAGYIKEFGDLIAKVFEQKITCIEKKKSIAFCQAAVNQNKLINTKDLENYITKEMAGYKTQLQAMREEYADIRGSKQIPDHEVQKVKAIYRRIAKKIHPDINPAIYENPEDETFANLWQEVMDAYHTNNLLKISNLEVIINKELKDRNIDTENLEIEDIDFKAEKLKEGIEEIKTTNPYLYKFLLEDEEAVKEKKEDLNRELKEYEEYEEELNKVLQALMINGVEVEWEQN